MSLKKHLGSLKEGLLRKSGFTPGTESQTVFKSASGYKGIILTDEELRKVQDASLHILKDFDNTARKYRIPYTLSGGSVLGAVRHQGFIPWDDDIDINITRKDFDRLVRLFNREWEGVYEIQYPGITPGYWFAQGRLIKKGTKYKTAVEAASQVDTGIGIDLFVMENTFNFRPLRDLHGVLCLAAGYLLTCRKAYNDYPTVKEYLVAGSATDQKFRKKSRIGRLFSFLDLDDCAAFAIRCYSLCKNHRSRYVTIPTGRAHYFRELDTRENLCIAEKMPFEDMLAPVPAAYDEYMSRLYGDYMTIPPVEKREKHPVIQIDTDSL